MTKEQSRKKMRQDILNRRDKLDAELRCFKSLEMTTRLWELPQFAKAKHIFTYINFRSEVETLPLVQQCLAKGILVSVPLTITAESRLAAYKITDPQNELRPGYCQIPEPDSAKATPVDPNDIDVVILPGSVFDEYGGRLGYGGGYYDRFLANDAPQALRIGVAFELQVVNRRLPLLPHDKLLDFLVTENRVLEFSRIEGEKYDQNCHIS